MRTLTPIADDTDCDTDCADTDCAIADRFRFADFDGIQTPVLDFGFRGLRFRCFELTEV